MSEAEKSNEMVTVHGNEQLEAKEEQPIKLDVSDENSEESFSSKLDVTLTMLLLILSLAPMFSFGLLFTDIGYGGTVHRALISIKTLYKIGLLGFMFLFFLIIYFFDCSSWSTGRKMFARGVLILCLCTLAVMLALAYPIFPILLFLLLLPVYYWVIYKLLNKGNQRHFLPNYLRSASIAIGLCGIASFIVWIIWVSNGHWWNATLRKKFLKEMNCSEDYCMAAFLLWCGHPLASFAVIIFSFLSWVLSESLDVTNLPESPQSQHKHHNLQLVVKIFLYSFLILFAGTWVAASIGGSQTGMANLVVICTFATGGCGVMLVGSVYGWSTLVEDLKASPKVQKMYGFLFSDWVLGLAGLMLLPPMLIFLFLSAINNSIRKCTKRTGEDESEEDNSQLFTKRVNQNIDMLWTKRNSTSILSKLIILGIGLIVMNVLLGKFVNVFMAFVLEVLAGMQGGLPAQTIVFVMIGLLMFLIPAIPGGPVYIAGGVLLVDPTWRAIDSVGSAEMNSNNTIADDASYKSNEGAFWFACLYAAIICLIIKFLAIAFEQKIIGEKAGKIVAVRSFVGVNKMAIRGTKKILEQKGLHFNKICILVGGPDWPTSVVTGILRLNIWQMLLGSFPVFFFIIIPSVIAGGFMLRPGPPYDTIQPIALAIAGGLNIAIGVMAGYFIEKTTNEHWDELSLIKPDAEVLKLEKENFKKLALNKGWNMWEGLEWFQKMLLIIASTSMSCAIWIFFLFGSSAFYDFQVTDSLVEKFGPGSNAFDIVRAPLGWVGIGLSVFSVVNYKIFSYLRQRNVKHTMEKFDVEKSKDHFKKLYDIAAEEEYKAEAPPVTIHHSMRSSIIDLFYKIMDKVLSKYLADRNSKLPIKEGRAKVYGDILSKDKLEKEIKGDKTVKFMTQSILRDGAEKIIEGLKSRKEWITKDELLSEKVKDDFAGVMAAEFVVIIHILKRKIKKDTHSSEKSKLLPNEKKSSQDPNIEVGK